MQINVLSSLKNDIQQLQSQMVKSKEEDLKVSPTAQPLSPSMTSIPYSKYKS